jgi:gamma-glutamyl phosphate reductase
MAEAEQLELVDEIKELERALFRKRARLAFIERFADFDRKTPQTPEEWQAEFDDLTQAISAISSGGDAVEDIRYERSRGA